MRALYVALLMLVGCATDADYDRMAAQAAILYGNDCIRQGWAENSDAWQRCIAVAYVRERQARIAAQPPMVLPTIDPNTFNNNRRTCTSYVNGRVIETTCQ